MTQKTTKTKNDTTKATRRKSPKKAKNGRKKNSETCITGRKKKGKKGHKFKSSTDTEVIAHLIEDNYNGDIEEATRKALKQIDGSYA